MKASVPPPDPNVGLAQKNMADIAQQAETRAAASDKYYQEVLAPRYLAQMDTSIALAKEQTAKQNELQDFQTGLAKKYDDRYWDTTAKQQDAFYDTVNKYDTSAARDEMAGQAGADVEQATAANNQALQRGLARRGVNPGSGAAISAMTEANTTGALAKAGAMTLAQRAARAEGLQLRAQAAGLGGNLTGATASFAAGASGTGGAALGANATGLQALNAYGSSLGQQTQSFNSSMGLASNSYGAVGNLGMQEWLEKSKVNQSNAAGANQLIGTAMGAGASMMSDRRLKTNIAKLGTRRDGLGVYSFNYVWGGPRFVGVMADEVKQLYPAAVSQHQGYDAVDYAKLGNV